MASVAAGGGSQQRISRGRVQEGLAATAVPGAKEARRMALSFTGYLLGDNYLHVWYFFFSRAPKLAVSNLDPEALLPGLGRLSRQKRTGTIVQTQDRPRRY